VSAGVIMAAIPAAVAVLSWLFLRERVAPRVWAAWPARCWASGCFRYRNRSMGHVGTSARADSHQNLSWLGNLLLVGRRAVRGQLRGDRQEAHRQLTPRRITALINLWGFALARRRGCGWPGALTSAP
jgi:hypothetical protein